jgi:transcriptional regulator with PAS, ATPase and Fis domain
MNTTESLKDYQRVRTLAIRSLFEIIEQSSEGTVIVDRDANIVWMNERYARRRFKAGVGQKSHRQTLRKRDPRQPAA